MDRDPVYLLDILQSVRDDLQPQDAVLRRIDIIGEAARRVSAETRDAHPEIPWNRMVSMRNLLIHDYDDVDLDIVRETAREDLPRLRASPSPTLPGCGQGRTLPRPATQPVPSQDAHLDRRSDR